MFQKARQVADGFFEIKIKAFELESRAGESATNMPYRGSPWPSLSKSYRDLWTLQPKVWVSGAWNWDCTISQWLEGIQWLFFLSTPITGLFGEVAADCTRKEAHSDSRNATEEELPFSIFSITQLRWNYSWMPLWVNSSIYHYFCQTTRLLYR